MRLIIRKVFNDLVSLNNIWQQWEIRPPRFLRLFFPGVVWRVPVSEKKVFLTFDDGPIPEVTPWVINCLKEHNAVATFFCVGDNIRKHPEVFRLLIESGMTVGNHTYHHTKAWKSNGSTFFADVDRFQQVYLSKLFRPPHGQLFPWWIRSLKQRFSSVVMWDVLSKDYHPLLNDEDVVNNVMRFVRPGSIIVFHDSIKSWPRLEMALPIILKKLNDNGFITETLSQPTPEIG